MNNTPKSVIVTGSSRGIGRAIAERLATDGWSVAVNYARNKTEADEVVANIKANGGNAIAIQADVAQRADVVRMFDETERAFSQVNAIVNNAGVMKMCPIVETDDETFDRTFAVNVRGVFLALREAAKRLPTGGRIVNLSTSATPLRLPSYGTYCATKAAVEVLTAILAKELRGRQITVNAVAPGPVGTELFLADKTQAQIDHMAKLNPFERLGEPQDIASVVAFLLTPEAQWINGQTVRANGGMV